MADVNLIPMNLPNINLLDMKIALGSIVAAMGIPPMGMGVVEIVIRFMIPIISGAVWHYLLKPKIEKWKEQRDENRQKRD